MVAIHDHKVAMGALGDHGPPRVTPPSHPFTPSLHPRPGRHLHPPPLPPHCCPGGSGRCPRLLHQVGATTSWGGDTWGHFGDNSSAPVSPPRRRRIQQAQLMKGPNKIILTMEDLTFINTQSSKRVRTLRGTFLRWSRWLRGLSGTRGGWEGDTVASSAAHGWFWP